MSQALFQPSPEANPFYKVAFDADFNQASNEIKVKRLFQENLSQLVTMTEEALATVNSVTQTTEIFYYVALSAALLQRKSAYRMQLIESAAPVEHSVAAMVVSQFTAQHEGDGNSNALTRDELDEMLGGRKINRHTIGSGLAEQMSKPFVFTGSAMRAVTILTVLAHGTNRGKKISSFYNTLCSYAPTNLLMEGNLSQCFPIIGLKHEYNHPDWSHRTIRNDERYVIERIPESRFCQVFAQKLAKLLASKDMNVTDRSRLEELRDFLFNALCDSFFAIHDINFPRILHLIDIVAKHTNADGLISEETLNEVCPSECTALLGNESILTKDIVDMNTSWYRINVGIRSFSSLINHYHLLNGYKLDLLNSIVK